MDSALTRRITAGPSNGNRSRIRMGTGRSSAATAAPSTMTRKRFATSAGMRWRRSSPLPQANSAAGGRGSFLFPVQSVYRDRAGQHNGRISGDGHRHFPWGKFGILSVPVSFYASAEEQNVLELVGGYFPRCFGRCIEKCTGCFGSFWAYRSCFFSPLRV